MTNETKQRIQYYQKMLPKMKERVIAAAMSLIIAISVTITSTYAWVTLSTAPEVVSIDTTVAANGSLEIALANGTGLAPGKSAVGDSTGAGTKINTANITWGNLVNLSDPSYGLGKITLRPAALNGTSGLLTNPLYGVGYGEDGRVNQMVTDDDFAYVYYDTESGKFLVDMDGDHLGVRAISTVKYENLEGDNTFAELLRLINQNITVAKSSYANMTNENQEPGSAYISSLEGLIQVYAQNVLDGKPETTLDVTKYIPDLYDMLKYFNDSVMMPVGESYVQMANLLELMKGSGGSDAGYVVESLVEASKAGTLPDYIKNNLKGLSSYANDYKTLQLYLKTSTKGDYSDLTASEKSNSLAYWAYYAKGGGTVYWSNIGGHANWICEINTATLDGYTMSGLSNMSTAMAVLGGSNPHSAIINGGAICRMEQRIGQKMSPTISVTVDPKSIVSFMSKMTLDAVLTTSAIDPYDVIADRDLVKSFNTGSFKGDTATAEDTYAMAIDLWLRTNAGSDGSERTEEITETLEDGTIKTTVVTTSAEKAYLTLEGAVKVGTEERQATIVDANGDAQPAYTASGVVDGTEHSLEVFRRYDVYYFMDNGKEIELETYLLEKYGMVPEITYTPKIEQQNVVIGYEGVNRVWNEEQMAAFGGESGTTTTQGGGSCYVFYASTPADQGRFLELLESMKVVFVNDQGRQIGTASMDTQNYFAETGKVTVPLVLDKTQAINLGTDINGKEIYGMTALTKDAATRITALIYLDGTKLTNDMVLASGDIQGTLNLQFGSSSALTRTTTTTENRTDGETITTSKTDYVTGNDNIAIEDEKVMNQYVEISAEIENNSFEYDPNKPAETTLTVTVDGVEPASVAARFMRAISNTQGVLQDSISLTGSGGTWSTKCVFDRPGKYVLRSVWVDGVEYDLSAPIEVTVTGSTVSSVTCEAITDGTGRATVMTASNSYSTDMTLGFTSSKSVPSRVNGIFMDENNRQVNVPFVLKDGIWSGTARFTTSGTFTMKYVEIDGDTYELQSALQPTLEILLGLKVSTRITASEETLRDLQSTFPAALATNFIITKDVPLQVAAEIYDNSGNAIKGLSGVRLYYGRAGSSILSNGLDSNLAWDSTTETYTGAFNVIKAGTYRFSRVTVGTNIIESYTSAPSIQAMPPDDAYYFNNYTETYQYSPQINAAMTIGIAYSNAAAKVEATITNGTTTEVVEGVMGLEAEDQGDKTVNLWSFKIPTINDSQEGEWRLKDITMYGVYFDGVYYDEENGKTLDLSSENIITKVANYLYVTLDVSKNRVFHGYFMEDHKVTDTTVTIADYEGNAIEGAEINDVKVVYYLDGNSVTLNTYGYTSTELNNVNVSGEGTLAKGSDTVYDVSEMNYNYAGPYKKCEVSFALNGTTIKAGAAGTKLVYKEDGKLLESLPQYEVTWEEPTVKITKINPAQGTKLNITSAGDSALGDPTQTEVTSWISDDQYAAVVFMKYDSGLIKSFTAPKVTLTLSNVGSNFSSVSLEVPMGTDANTPKVYSFAPNKLSVENSIGQAQSLVIATQHNDCGYQQISQISMTGKDGRLWTANLSHDIVINEQGFAPELKFTGLSGYDATIPATLKTSSAGVMLSQDGSSSMNITVPASQSWKQSSNEVENTNPGTTTETNTVVYYSKEEGGTCDKKTYYYVYNRNTKTTVAEAIERSYEFSYLLDQWKINGVTCKSGTIATISGNWTATAMPTLLSKELLKQETVTSTTTVILDSNETKTETKPNNATAVNESDICKTAKTTVTTTTK